MKRRFRWLCLFLSLVLLLSCSGCSLLRNLGRGESGGSQGSSHGSSQNSGEDILREPDSGDLLRRFGYDVLWVGIDAYGIVSCKEDDFSTLVSFPMSQLWEDGTGLYLSMHTDSPGVIPYVIISRNKGVTLDPENYLTTRFLPEMKEAYGSDLLRSGKAESVTIGGRTLAQMEFEYRLPEEGVRIIMRRVCGMIDDSFVIFTAKKTSDDNDAVFTSLEEIITYYQNGTNVYTAGSNLSDGSSSTGSGTDLPGDGFGDYTLTRAEPLTLKTVTVSNDVFSMEVPENWILMTHKQFSDFGIYLYDPEVPERKIFFYCKMEFFNKTQAEKNYYSNLASLSGITSLANDPYGYLLSASVPVLDPPTTARFYQVFPDFVSLLYQVQGYTYIYPDLNGVQVLEQYASTAPTTPACLDNTILRISFTADSGTACEGLVGGEVADKISFYQDGIDLGIYCVYDMMGITAPEGEFAELEEVLLRCLTSFTFTSDYVRQTQQNTANETDAILAAARSMQAAYDSYNAAWRARQTSYDIIFQKNSDATLGYDRLYDPDTGEVYRADVGFYDYYDTHRSDYSNSNLQILDNSTQQYYLQPVDYYITR